MSGLWDLPEVFAKALADKGFAAAVKYAGAAGRVGEGTAIAVSLGSARLCPLGMGDYLGEEDLGTMGGGAVFARRFEGELVLELFAVKTDGEAAVRRACESLIGALTTGAVDGFVVEEQRMGAVSFDEKAELFTLAVTVTVGGYLRARFDAEEQVFTDFEVRSEMI